MRELQMCVFRKMDLGVANHRVIELEDVTLVLASNRDMTK